MNTIIKNKSKQSGLPAQSGFINLIILIVGALLLMRYYHLSVSDVTHWINTLSVDRVIGWFKDLVNWCQTTLESVWKNTNQ